jgi:predicted dehydrogenase
VAGNEVFAHYAFPGGMNATFSSCQRLREATGFWGLELTGSKGVARINCDTAPNAFLRSMTKDGTVTWQPFNPDTVKQPDAHPLDPVADWLEAIRDHREPVCSLKNAAQAVEMVCAVYAAALSGSRIAFPLKERRHPLE